MMRMGTRFITAIIAALIFSGAQHGVQAGTLPDNFSPCRLPNSSVMAECGYIERPENPADPAGKTININVAVLPALSSNAEPDPLFMLEGGPGGSAINSFPTYTPLLNKLRYKRDIVLIDQRGTGGSNPLTCTLEDSDSFSLEPAVIKQQMQACLEQLAGDPRYYTTTIAVADFDAVRKALGYDQINLFGVSYGTRAAQAYLRDYPGTLRSVILDGLAPNELLLPAEHALNLQHAVEQLIARCAQDKDCNEHFPNLSDSLDTLVTRLEQQPVDLNITSPSSGKKISMSFSRWHLGSAIRILAYSDMTQALLPLLIDEAARTGDLSRLAQQARMIEESIGEAVSVGAERSVICSEDAPYYSTLPTEILNDEELLLGGMMAYSDLSCAVWPRGEVPSNFHEPVESDLPALLLSGETDPVTPPAYGEQVLKSFNNGRHLIAPGKGHGVFRYPCIADVMTEFVEKGSAEQLDTECLQLMAPAPFFTSLQGPTP